MSNTNQANNTSDPYLNHLENLMAERKRMMTEQGHQPAEEKQGVSLDEYRRRLASNLAKEQNITSNRDRERIDNALAQWEAKVGPRFAKAKIEIAPVKDIVEARVQNFKTRKLLHRSSLVMTGILGAGKTWNGYAYLRRLVEEGVLTSQNMMIGTETEIISPIAMSSFEKSRLIQDLLKPAHKIFFIDEVGGATFRESGMAHEAWYVLINHCYENNIPVIMTSNKSTKKGYGLQQMRPGESYENQLEEWIGPRAYDRLKTMVGPDGMIVPNAENMRGKASEEMDKL